MTLNKFEKNIVQENPLPDSLKDIRKTFSDGINDPSVESVLNLLLFLSESSAANMLSVKTRDVSLSVDLYHLRSEVRAGNVGLAPFRLLIECIVDDAPENIIWEAVLNLFSKAGPVTPLSSNALLLRAHPQLRAESLPSTSNATPFKTNSSRLSGSESSQDVEKELLNDIGSCFYRDVEGFFERFFNPKLWTTQQKKMLKSLRTDHSDGRWKSFPTGTSELDVRTGFLTLQEKFLKDASNKIGFTSNSHQMNVPGSQLDLFFGTGKVGEDRYRFEDLLVIGELKSTPDPSRLRKDLKQLSRYVLQTLIRQPHRLFVHAFLLCGAQMDCFVYDRSGLFGSGPFNIHEHPDRFARVITAYATLQGEDIGQALFVTNEGRVTLDLISEVGLTARRTRSNVRTFQLVGEPLSSSTALFSRGTTCYLTEDHHVAKFAWATGSPSREIDLLLKARQAGVIGVASLVAHRAITSISKIREGLQFGQRHVFRSNINQGNVAPISSNTKRQYTQSSHQRSSATKARLTHEVETSSSSYAGETESQAASDISLQPWQDKVYTCIVVTPAGKALSDFRDAEQLVGSLLDAIKGHKSLFCDAGILHRDISPNNIILTDSKQGHNCRGMLIDLDVAKEMGTGRSRVPHRTGTKPFMSINVLHGIDHSCRDDLESFFYVLIWMCASRTWTSTPGDGRNTPHNSRLRKWEMGSIEEITESKTAHVGSPNAFLSVLNEFASSLESVKPLCLAFRSILFGPFGEMLDLSTPANESALYDPIIDLFATQLEFIQSS